MLYFVVRDYEENSGSYAGFVEMISRVAHTRGYNVMILCAKCTDAQKLKEKKQYATIIRFPIKRPLIPFSRMNQEYLSLAPHVRKYLKENPPARKDILIANGLAALGLIGRQYILRIGQPAQVFLRNMEMAKEEVSILSRIARRAHFRLQAMLERHCVRNACGFITPSKETRYLAVARYGGQDKPYFIPQAGIKKDAFSDNKRNEQYGLEKKKKRQIILFIASGNKERVRKGFHLIEKTIPSIFTEIKNAVLLHVGEHAAWNVPEWCKNRIVRVGKVSWRNMKKHYEHADVFVSCALNEGFPNTVLEAMAAGTPIVTSDIQGIHEYITHGKSGLIFKRGNTEELKEQIMHMLKHPDDAQRMGWAAQKKVRVLEYSSFAKKLLTFAKNVAEGRKKPVIVNLLAADSKKEHT